MCHHMSIGCDGTFHMFKYTVFRICDLSPAKDLPHRTTWNYHESGFVKICCSQICGWDRLRLRAKLWPFQIYFLEGFAAVLPGHGCGWSCISTLYPFIALLERSNTAIYAMSPQPDTRLVIKRKVWVWSVGWGSGWRPSPRCFHP